MACSLLVTTFSGFENIQGVTSATISRITTGGIEPAYIYMETYPNKYDYLLGKSLPNPGGLLPYEPARSSFAVGEDLNTDGAGQSGDGGVGRVSEASGSPVYYAGGGGGSYYDPNPGGVGAAGQGGGSAGVTNGRSSPGTNGTGGGSGAGGHPGGGAGTGGSGIIIIRH